MPTLPDHSRCDRHRHYRLSCDQYEALLAECGQKCAICRKDSSLSNWGKLHIDHDGPLWAVRGLLCHACNTHLGSRPATLPGSQQYLASAWWERQCAANGLPLTRRPEPALGSAIRNQFGTIWVRHEGNWWAAPAEPRGPNALMWGRLHDSYGAHNLVPYDLRAAYENGTLPEGVRYPIENGTGWGGVRAALGVPEPPPRVGPPWKNPRDVLPWLKTPELAASALQYFFTPGECLRIAELLAKEDS